MRVCKGLQGTVATQSPVLDTTLSVSAGNVRKQKNTAHVTHTVHYI